MKILCAVLFIVCIVFAIVARIISTRREDNKLTGILFFVNCGICLAYALVTILGFWSEVSLLFIAICLSICSFIWIKQYRPIILAFSVIFCLLLAGVNAEIYVSNYELSDEIHTTTSKYTLYEEDTELGNVFLVSSENSSEYYYFYEGSENEVCINKIPCESTKISYISAEGKPYVIKTVQTQYYLDGNKNPPVQIEEKEETISYVMYITEDALKVANFAE